MSKMNISEFKRGWIIGNFEPSILKSDFEVMVRKDKKGDTFPRHFHKEATEYNVVINGKYKVDDEIYSSGDIFVIQPYKSSESECLESGEIVCVKNKSVRNDKYIGSVLNIVIPMAGRSSRFFNVPKAIIPIGKKTMIETVIDNIKPKCEHRYIFICLKHHKRFLKPILSDLGEIIWIDEVTEGAACTVLKAKEFIDNNDRLMISDCDQIIDMDFEEFYNSNSDVTVLTTTSSDPSFSYVEVSGNSIIRSAEKEVISNISPCGKHLFKHGKYFVEASEKMIRRRKKVNGEYYITPIYNEMLDKDLRIFHTDGWHDIGTPENLKKYLEGK